MPDDDEEVKMRAQSAWVAYAKREGYAIDARYFGECYREGFIQAWKTSKAGADDAGAS